MEMDVQERCLAQGGQRPVDAGGDGNAVADAADIEDNGSGFGMDEQAAQGSDHGRPPLGWVISRRSADTSASIVASSTARASSGS